LAVHFESEQETLKKRLKELLEDAEWDRKARDWAEALDKLREAKEIAKKLRNGQLLKDVLDKIEAVDLERRRFEEERVLRRRDIRQ